MVERTVAEQMVYGLGIALYLGADGKLTQRQPTTGKFEKIEPPAGARQLIDHGEPLPGTTAKSDP